MTNLETWLRELIATGEEWRFYKSRQWLELRNRVLEKHHNECQECLQRGKYTRAKVVHHVNEVKNRPDLALNEYYTDGNGEQRENLKALCIECHNKEHNRIGNEPPKKPLNDEKW